VQLQLTSDKLVALLHACGDETLLGGGNGRRNLDVSARLL
jgi:hypothetical protein